MNYIIPYLPVLIETSYMLYFFNCLMSRKKTTYIDYIYLLTITLTLGSIESSSIFSPIFTLIITTIFLFIVTKKNLTGSLIIYALTIISLISLQFIVVIITSIIGLTGTDYKMQILCNILTLLLIILLCKLFNINKIYTFALNSKLPIKLTLINSFLIVFAVLIIFKLNRNNIYMNIPTFLAVFSLFLTANICILYYEKTLNLKQSEIISYQKNIPIYETLIDEIRSNQHEYSNRIQTLKNLSVTCTDYDSLKKALNEYSSEVVTTCRTYPLLQINMPLLAAALYSLSDKAAKDEIIVQFNIKSSVLNSNAPEYELSDFACILLQNAIEACRANDYINAELYSENGQFYFSVINPVERFYSKAEMASFLKNGYTTKTDKTSHGYGLYYVHKNLRKYNGTIGFDCIEYDNRYWIKFEIQV